MFVGSRRVEQLSLRSQQRVVATVEESVLKIEMAGLESQEEDLGFSSRDVFPGIDQAAGRFSPRSLLKVNFRLQSMRRRYQLIQGQFLQFLVLCR